MDSFQIHKSSVPQVPIIISVPHCGIHFPEEIKEEFDEKLIERPDDTDWFVDQLYDFAPSMGMTMITAIQSRWIIDLNRDPENKPLYTDGRIITGLCPTTDFLGNNIYKDKRKHVESAEIQRRLDQYYRPYHSKLSKLLSEIRSTFKCVLLWDCHSIRQFVPTIHPEKFPDLILGSSDETSASPELIKLALASLSQSEYKLTHNYPFKGGFITRNYGKPQEKMHAIQLEMSKVNYMDSEEKRYDKMKATRMRELLNRTLGELAKSVLS